MQEPGRRRPRPSRCRDPSPSPRKRGEVKTGLRRGTRTRIMRLRRVVCGMALVAAIAAATALWSIAFAESELEHPHWQGHAVKAPSKDYPIEDITSGFWFRTKDTQALQEDDFSNPGFFAVEEGEQLWVKPEGAAGKSCASCHQDAAISMKGVGAATPKWNERLVKPVNLEQQINICRSERMGAEPWKFGSAELTAMTTYVRYQSRGMPVAVRV